MVGKGIGRWGGLSDDGEGYRALGRGIERWGDLVGHRSGKGGKNIWYPL